MLTWMSVRWLWQAFFFRAKVENLTAIQKLFLFKPPYFKTQIKQL